MKTSKSPSGNTPPERNETLFQQLTDYQARHNISDAQLGNKLSSSAAYVSRYRSNKFEGDLQAFELKIEQLLVREELMEGDNEELTTSGFCVEAMTNFLDLVSNQRQMGVGYGPAGRGKTSAARLYAIKHKQAVYVHIYTWTSSRDAFVRELARAAGVRRMRNESFYSAVARVLKNADRLIIIDNAQRLTEGTRRFLADFHDATRSPIALIGNPEIVRQFERNEQHGSRLGRCVDVATITDTRSTVLHLLKTYLPVAQNDNAAMTVSLDVLKRETGGAARSLKMHLRLAERMLRSNSSTTPSEAIKLAQTQLTHQEAA